MNGEVVADTIYTEVLVNGQPWTAVWESRLVPVICPSKEEDDRNFEPLKPRRVVAKALQNGLSLSLFFVLCPLFFVILRKPEFRILGRS